MKSIHCFEVLGHTDTTEGRGPMKVVTRFSKYGEAEKFVTSKSYAKWCVMGYQDYKSVINNIRETVLVVLDSVDELEQERKALLKATALAKLSKEEREVLGL